MFDFRNQARWWSLLFVLVAAALSVFGQKDFYQSYKFTAADTLRGMLRPERSCYDVTFYDIVIRIETTRQSVAGYVDIYYRAIAAF